MAFDAFKALLKDRYPLVLFSNRGTSSGSKTKKKFDPATDRFSNRGTSPGSETAWTAARGWEPFSNRGTSPGSETGAVEITA